MFSPHSGLTGKPDYLYQINAHVIPIEVKTSRTPHEPYLAHIFQLAAYCLLVEDTFQKTPPYGYLHYRNLPHSTSTYSQTWQIPFTRQLKNQLLQLLEEMRRGDAGNLAADDQYRRTVLGSDMSARIQSGMAIRKIAITSPKGGTGKTTVAVNLAVALALSGITTYLVDADGNAGALSYHMRLERVNTTLIGLLRRELAQRKDNHAMSTIANGAAYLNAFTPLENLPTLKVLPGLVTDDLGDEVLQQEERVEQVINGLYEAGVAAGGVVIMDVGINPAHVVHRAALKAAEGIAIVIKPEIPDLAETRRWIARMINSLAAVVGKGGAHEFVGSRVKLCYNQVVGDGFKSAHKMLQQALAEDKIELALIPNGILPIVDPRLTAQAVNSDKREDILIWRYRKEKLEELGPFSESLLGFASHFVPAVREGASRVGLLPSVTKKRSWFGK
uniref:Uncharacterized protein n=1 Tax=Anaerolinea thermolimosa TaxID=229919 RepID=A0A7C4PI16_9CHLR